MSVYSSEDIRENAVLTRSVKHNTRRPDRRCVTRFHSDGTVTAWPDLRYGRSVRLSKGDLRIFDVEAFSQRELLAIDAFLDGASPQACALVRTRGFRYCVLHLGERETSPGVVRVVVRRRHHCDAYKKAHAMARQFMSMARGEVKLVRLTDQLNMSNMLYFNQPVVAAWPVFTDDDGSSFPQVAILEDHMSIHNV